MKDKWEITQTALLSHHRTAPDEGNSLAGVSALPASFSVHVSVFVIRWPWKREARALRVNNKPAGGGRVCSSRRSVADDLRCSISLSALSHPRGPPRCPPCTRGLCSPVRPPLCVINARFVLPSMSAAPEKSCHFFPLDPPAKLR